MTDRAIKRVLLASAIFLGAAGFVPLAHADGRWAAAHPRRDQVNDRLANQSRRINQEYRAGEITRGQAAQLHREDHQVRQEERLMASQSGSHITCLEQQALNQQENRISRQIGP
jgi:hypothetical protein